jgi:DNA-binding response OmpR family regulator
MTCREASTAREAVDSAIATPPDLFIVDLVLPDQSGLGL